MSTTLAEWVAGKLNQARTSGLPSEEWNDVLRIYKACCGSNAASSLQTFRNGDRVFIDSKKSNFPLDTFRSLC